MCLVFEVFLRLRSISRLKRDAIEFQETKRSPVVQQIPNDQGFLSGVVCESAIVDRQAGFPFKSRILDVKSVGMELYDLCRVQVLAP